MNSYKVLTKQIYTDREFSIVPIRFEDRMDIMKWRNEQIYHLRQSKPLTIDDQDRYFSSVIAGLFEQENPDQILFSFLKNGDCIGYGGLVHINWIDRHAEISFVMDTLLEKEFFQETWIQYLKLIEQAAFNGLGLHKIFTYAFDLRPHLYNALENSGFQKEAVLKEHCLFEGRTIDVIIHSKTNTTLSLTKAVQEDNKLTYYWANNSEIRAYSFSKQFISFEEHVNWFSGKINNDHCLYFILRRGCNGIGSMRIDFSKNKEEGTISYLIDPKEHGKGYGRKIVEMTEEILVRNGWNVLLVAYVQEENTASLKIFKALNYELEYENERLKFTKRTGDENRK